MYGPPVLSSSSSSSLLGYAYSDLVVRRLHARAQLWLHLALLALSCLMLPIVPGAHWKPLGGESPAPLLLGLLALTVGLPYFLLATTSPLVQSWFARRFPGRSPYRLFALSNLASMLALAGYPFALAMGDDPNAVLRMVRRLPGVRTAVCRMRVVQLADSTANRCEGADGSSRRPTPGRRSRGKFCG
jgi:hypothetical protein